MAGIVSQTPYAIGYIGSEYAFAMDIPQALLRNAAGKFVTPSTESISAAARGDIPADARVMITNPADGDAYPVCCFTWIVLYKEQAYGDRPKARAEETLRLIDWLLGPEAQAMTEEVNYAPLPASVAESAREILRSVTYKGEPIL